MKLLIDIGNTRLKWALASTAELLETGTIFHEGEPAAKLHALPKKPVEAIWLTHVIGTDHEPAIIENLHARYGFAPRLARATESWNGLRNAYREPQRLGVDRWLAMIAAWQDAGRAAPVCVVDAGTALTADAIAQDGAHLGGIIAAGLQTQQRAVLGATHIAARDTAPPSPRPSAPIPKAASARARCWPASARSIAPPQPPVRPRAASSPAATPRSCSRICRDTGFTTRCWSCAV